MKNVLFLFISFLSFLFSKAQTANDVIKKWTNAMGGGEKLASIKSVYTENELNIMNNPASGKSYILNGKGFKSEIELSGQIIIDCYTVNGGWSINPLAGQPTAVNMPEGQIKMGQLSFDATGPLYNYGSKGSKVELLGKEDLKGSSTYKIKLTSSAGTEVVYYINDSSYYIMETVAKMNVNGQDIEITTALSDYRKTADGYIMPYSSELDFPGLTIGFTNKKIEVNKEIDPAIFVMPKN